MRLGGEIWGKMRKTGKWRGRVLRRVPEVRLFIFLEFRPRLHRDVERCPRDEDDAPTRGEARDSLQAAFLGSKLFKTASRPQQ